MKKKSTWYQHWIAEGFRALEKTLKIFCSKGQFCFGESPGLADVCLIPQVYNGLRFNCDLSGYPRIQSIWVQWMILYPLNLPHRKPNQTPRLKELAEIKYIQ